RPLVGRGRVIEDRHAVALAADDADHAGVVLLLADVPVDGGRPHAWLDVHQVTGTVPALVEVGPAVLADANAGGARLAPVGQAVPAAVGLDDLHANDFPGALEAPHVDAFAVAVTFGPRDRRRREGRQGRQGEQGDDGAGSHGRSPPVPDLRGGRPPGLPGYRRQ